MSDARSRDQQRGLHAKAKADGAAAAGTGLRDGVADLAARIRLAGLCAALQFGDVHRSDEATPQSAAEAASALEDWMQVRFPGTKGVRLADRLTSGDVQFWMEATAESFRYLEWLKIMARLPKP